MVAAHTRQSDRAKRRRRRISKAHSHVRDQQERIALRQLRSFYASLSRDIMARVKGLGVTGLQVEDVFQPAQYRDRFNARMTPVWNQTAWRGVLFETDHQDQQQSLWLPDMVRQDVSGDPPPSIKVDPSPDLVRSIRDYLREREAGLWGTVSRTMGMQLRRSLTKSAREGDDFNTMQKRLQGRMKSLSNYQARRIARTETTGFMNHGQQSQRVDIGIELKEWISRIDRYTRGVQGFGRWNHIAPDGQVVKNLEAFTVSGEKLMYPGDSRGSAGNIIQCRCSSVASFEEEPTAAVPVSPDQLRSPLLGNRKADPDRFNLRGERRITSDHSEEEAAEHWDRLFRGQANVDDYLSRTMEGTGWVAGDSDIHFEESDGNVSVRINSALDDPEGNRVGSLERIVMLRDGKLVVRHNYFSLPESAQGKGLSKGVLSNQMKLWEEIGVERVELNANINVGGYAWSRYGFKPTQGEWNKLRKSLRDDVARSNLTGDEKSILLKVLNSDDPRGIWTVADMSRKVTNKDVFVVGLKKDKPLKIGQRLLMDSNWNGGLDLKDQEQMERFRNYLDPPVPGEYSVKKREREFLKSVTGKEKSAINDWLVGRVTTDTDEEFPHPDVWYDSIRAEQVTPGSQSDEVRESLGVLDKMLDRAPATQHGTVYRGLTVPPSAIEGAEAGSFIELEAHTSWTKDVEIAESFAIIRREKVVTIIEVENATSGVHITQVQEHELGLSGKSIEEVLAPKGTRYQVKEVGPMPLNRRQKFLFKGMDVQRVLVKEVPQ